jgi:serine/threonine-protein kinase
MADDDFKPSRAPGDRIVNYVIVRLLGRGGLSEVYLGRNVVAVKRVVAIKVLARRFQERPDLRKRLEREAAIYDALDHPNIVRMHDIGLLDDGAVYIVMDLIRGRTLREHMALGPLDLHGALHIMIQVTSAMCFAHRKDVIHRDLKPENIMVTPDADVKVLDFGIAKWSQGGEESNEMPKLGTIAFLAPEQIAKKPVDGRADIYALGVIFYILLNKGQHPFENDDGETTDAEMIARHLHAQPRPLHEFIENCPPSASLIVSKCLAKDPDDRYATMDDLLDDLSALIHESLPPNDPIAQRAVEEQEIKRVSGVQFIAGQSEILAQRETAPLVNFTPPASVTPFDRPAQSPPPLVARGKGYTAPMPVATSSESASGRVAVPPGVAAALSAVGVAAVPTRVRVAAAPAGPAAAPNVAAQPAGSRVSPSAAKAPALTLPPVPPSPAATPPVAPTRPAFAPARTDLTPSSSEADGPAGRTNKRSEPMQPRPVNVKSAPVSNKSVVLLAIAAGLIFAAFVASMPGFRAAVRAAPTRAEATAATPAETAPHAGAAPGEGAQEPARDGAAAGATATADPAAPVDVPASAVPPVSPTPTGEVPSPVAPPPSSEPAAAAPPAAPTQTAAPASTTSAQATPAAARSAPPLPTAKPKASPPPRTKTPATPAPPPTAAPEPFFMRPKPDAAPAPPPTAPHRIFGSEG